MIDGTPPWTPAIARYVSKLGSMAKVDSTPASIYCRYESLASMFAGRVEFMYNAFRAAAARVYKKHSGAIEAQAFMRVMEFDEVNMATGLVGKQRVTRIRAALKSEATFPSTGVQLNMVNCSLFEDPKSRTFSAEDLGRALLWAEDQLVYDYTDPEAPWSMMPVSLQ